MFKSKNVYVLIIYYYYYQDNKISMTRPIKENVFASLKSHPSTRKTIIISIDDQPKMFIESSKSN